MEIWDLVRADGSYAEVRWPRDCHDEIPEGLYHLCVEVWVRVGKKLLLTRRHPEKTEGLKLDCPGGAVLSGESVINGALRELYEEVGIKADKDSLIHMGELALGKAYAHSYLLQLVDMPNICVQPEEVCGYILVDKSEFEGIRAELTRGTARRYDVYKDFIF